MVNIVGRTLERLVHRLRPLSIDAQLARVARTGGGRVSLAATHVETGRTLGYGADASVMMASTVKIAIAVHVLRCVDEGTLCLDELVPVTAADLRPGSGVLGRAIRPSGVILSVGNLLRLAMIESDNTATDLLLARSGGPSAVGQRMRTLGIAPMSVDRTMLDLVCDVTGVGRNPGVEGWTPTAWSAARAALPPEQRAAASARLLTDTRDTTTAATMVRLLVGIWRAEVIAGPGRDLLLEHMASCATGARRLRRELPRGTFVASRTGTIEQDAASDVGIVGLPGGLGHMVIAAYVSQPGRSLREQEAVIARLASLSFQHFARS